MKKYIVIVLGVVLILSGILNFYLGSMYVVTKKNEETIAVSLKEIEAEYNELDRMADEKLLEICDLYYEKKLRDLLQQEDINYLSFMAWEYKIQINGEDITSPLFYTRSDSVEVTFIENKKNDLLPKGISARGRISASEAEFKKLVKTEFKEEADVKFSDDNEERKLTYYYSDVDAGDVVTVRLSPLIIERMKLYERINLEDDKIEVIKNR